MFPLPFIRDHREIPALLRLQLVFQDFAVNFPICLAPKGYPLAVDGADRLVQPVLADAIFTFLRHFFLSSCCIARGIVLYCE